MINSDDLCGIIVPIVTPVERDETVDHAGLRGVVRHVLDGGVHGVFVLGGTGNFCSFSPQERFEIAQMVVQEVNGQVPVLVGCMDSTTRLAILHAQCAFEAGADAIVMEPPYYYLCTDADVLSHFNAVAKITHIPMVVYHNPIETKVHLSLPMMRELAAAPKVIGVKDSSYDFVFFQELLSEFSGSQFGILQGQEPLAGASFLLGAQGAILAMANVIPHLCTRLFDAGSSGQVQETRLIQTHLMIAAQILRSRTGGLTTRQSEEEETTASFFAGLQCAMKALNLCEKVITAPFPEPLPADYARAAEILASLETTQ